MVIYDGIHYDALALAPSPDAPESADQTVFNHSRLGPEKLAAIEASALELTRLANKVSLPALTCGRAETSSLLTSLLAIIILRVPATSNTSLPTWPSSLCAARYAERASLASARRRRTPSRRATASLKSTCSRFFASVQYRV